MSGEDARKEDVPDLATVGSEIAVLGKMVGGLWLDGVGAAVSQTVGRPFGIAAGLARRSFAPTRPAIGKAYRPANNLVRGAIATTTPSGRPQGDPAQDLDDGSGLRARGEALLLRSANIHDDEDQHPAYRRILEELAPDEARILRLLRDEGPQPVVEVRSGLPPGTRVVAGQMTMLSSEAGCRYPARVPAYLDNLARLGLISTAREAVADPGDYQLVEAQPEVVAALSTAGRTGRTSRGAIRLTPFGIDFCRTCFP